MLEEIKKSAEAIYKYGNDENTVRSEANHILELLKDNSVEDYEKKARELVANSISKAFLG